VGLFHAVWYRRRGLFLPLDFVAVCCSCVAVCCSVFGLIPRSLVSQTRPVLTTGLYCIVLHCVAVCCSVLQCVRKVRSQRLLDSVRESACVQENEGVWERVGRGRGGEERDCTYNMKIKQNIGSKKKLSAWILQRLQCVAVCCCVLQNQVYLNSRHLIIRCPIIRR